MLPGAAGFWGANRRDLEESDSVELHPADSGASEVHNEASSRCLEKTGWNKCCPQEIANYRKEEVPCGLLLSIFPLAPPVDRT